MRSLLSILILTLSSCAATSAPSVQAEPRVSRRIVFVIDAAMRYRDVAPVEAVETGIYDLQQDDQFGVLIADDTRPARLDAHLLAASPDNKRRAAFFLSNLKKCRTADIVRAIQDSTALSPRVIWLVTDGNVDDAGPVLDAARRARKAGMQISTVLSFSTEANDRRFLYELAQAGGGICRDENGVVLHSAPAGSRDRGTNFQDRDIFAGNEGAER